MAYIGNLHCDAIRGTFPTRYEEKLLYDVPGTNGTGIVLLGRRSVVQPVRFEKFGLRNEVLNWKQAFYDLQYEILPISNDVGESQLYCNLIAVRQASVIGSVGFVHMPGGGGRYFNSLAIVDADILFIWD